MIRSRRRRPGAGALARRAAIGLTVALAVAVPGRATGPDGAAGPDSAAPVGERVALLVFVSYPGRTPLPLHPTVVRLRASEGLAAAVGASGSPVLAYPALEDPMRRWRVRSESDLSPEFLETLVRDSRVERLVVARLVFHRDRILLLLRRIDPRTGILDGADVVERQIDPGLWVDPDEALAQVDRVTTEGGRALAALAERARTAAPLGTMILMPLRPVGVPPGPALLASQCLLRSLLDVGGWTVPDPAIVRAALQRAGHDPFLLDAAARAELAERFGADALLVPRIVSFPAGPERSRLFVAEDDETERAFESVQRLPLQVSLLLVDCGTGGIVSGQADYLAPESPVGIFGMTKELRIARRFGTGIDRLVRSLIPDREDP